MRCQLLKDFCEKKNIVLQNKSKNITWYFKTITEENIYTNRLQNIMRFHEVSLILPEQLILDKIFKLFDKKSINSELMYYSDLKLRLEKELATDRISSSQLEQILYFLLYHHYLFFDYDREFSVSTTKIIINTNLEYLNRPFIESGTYGELASAFNPKIVPANFDIDKLDKN